MSRLLPTPRETRIRRLDLPTFTAVRDRALELTGGRRL